MFISFGDKPVPLLLALLFWAAMACNNISPQLLWSSAMKYANTLTHCVVQPLRHAISLVVVLARIIFYSAQYFEPVSALYGHKFRSPVRQKKM